MVYISSWQEYQEAAEALYQKSPNKTRYVVKWRAVEAKLVLKITDDTTALNLSLMQKMQNRVAPPASSAPDNTEQPQAQGKDAPAAQPTAGAPSGGGVKKKKPKKKK